MLRRPSALPNGAPTVLPNLPLEATQFRLRTSRSMTPCRRLVLPRPVLMEGLKPRGPPATVVTAVVRAMPSLEVEMPKQCPVVTLMLYRPPWLNRVTPRQFRRTLVPEHPPLTRIETSTLCSPCVMALLAVRHLVTGLLLLWVRADSMPPMHRRASAELFRRLLFSMQARKNVWNMFRMLMLARLKKCPLLWVMMVRRTVPETPPSGMILWPRAQNLVKVAPLLPKHTAECRGSEAILKLTFLIVRDGTMVPVVPPVVNIVGTKKTSAIMLLFMYNATHVTINVSICRMARAPPPGTMFTSKRWAHQIYVC